MQLFSYAVKDAAGKTVKGKVEAQDLPQAAEILRQRQLVIIELKPIIGSGSFAFLDEWFGRVKQEDIVTFTRQLSTMINSGLPLTDSFSILRNQAKPHMAKIIDEVLRDIQGGSSLGDALGKHKQAFSDVYISLVRAGEAAGKLDEVLLRLAETEEKRREFAAKTKGALIYPVIVLIGMVAVIMVMMVFVIPKLTVMYDDFGAELPLPTQILITVSNIMQKMWYLVILAFGGLIYGLQAYRKTPVGRKHIDQILLNMPVMGPLRKQIALTEFSRTLSLLVGSGISILEALEIVSHSLDNVIIREALNEAARGVEKGLPLASMLARQEVFPPLISQMISVGEETGELDSVLSKVATYFESESEHAVKNLTTAMEPLIMVVLGVGVGFLVIAIVMPLYNLTSQF